MDLLTPLLSFFSTSFVAAFAAFLGWWLKRSEWRRDIIRTKIISLNQLYADFLAEADRLALMGFDEKLDKMGMFQTMMKLFSSIELQSADAITESARYICAHLIEAHTKNPNPETTYFELKKRFIAAVRVEIDQYQNS